MSDIVLQCEGLTRRYEDGDNSVTVLRGVDLVLHAREKVAIVGGWRVMCSASLLHGMPD